MAAATTTFGCERCFGGDASAAWAAARARPIAALVEESHFSVRLTACTCGQRFVVVFTERIDWSGGEDDQTWLVLPLTAAEVELLTACSDENLERSLFEVGRERRCLVHAFPTGGALSTWWREGGFAVGPHD